MHATLVYNLHISYTYPSYSQAIIFWYCLFALWTCQSPVGATFVPCRARVGVGVL